MLCVPAPCVQATCACVLRMVDKIVDLIEAQSEHYCVAQEWDARIEHGRTCILHM